MTSILLVTTLITIFAVPEAMANLMEKPQNSIAFTLTQASKTLIDVSGVWLDKRGKKWMVTQQGDQVTLLNKETKVSLQGTLKDRVIRTTSQITLVKNRRQECQDYIETMFEYETRLVVSKDGNKMVEKPPDSVSKGSCKLSLKKKPPFTLSRPKLNES